MTTGNDSSHPSFPANPEKSSYDDDSLGHLPHPESAAEEERLLMRSEESAETLRGSEAAHRPPLSVRRTDSGYQDAESHQYEQDENEVWWHHQLQRHFQDKGRWWTFARKTEFLRWILTLITGLACGVLAFIVTTSTKHLTDYKYHVFYKFVQHEKLGLLPMGSSFLFLFLINLGFGFIAWCLVWIEPLSAGSGIPEIKCYLNGLNIPNLLTLRTLICKAIGIIFSCCAGLPLGKEGPMVHIGAVLAAMISQGRFLSCGMIPTTFANFQDLRNDREKRDFVACGSAAGVAAAFGAPIGGVLFSLEEGASFWSTALTWRSFFCAMTTVFFLYAFHTAQSLFGHSDMTAMFSFGEFFNLFGEQSNYSVWELFLFMVLGYLGGLIGAFFNHCVGQIFHWRRVYVNSASARCYEVLAIVSLMSSLAYCLSFLWQKCTALPVNMDGWTEEEKALVERLVPLYCNAETEYNEVASLYLTDSDTAVRQLFHFREIGDHNDATFSSAALFLFFLPYLTMACLTYGSAVPAGMFVPSLLSGAAFGRLLGHLLHKLDNTRGTFADSGTYALMGAAAITSGIARMTISLTVMILEATGDMQYVLPLMLTVLTARLMGNIFTEGLYDLHIHRKQLQFLEEDEGQWGKEVKYHDLTVSDIMTPAPYSFPPIVKVGECLDLLRRGKHHCYPVVDEEDGDVFVGTIARKVLCTLLKLKAYGASTSHLPAHVVSSPLANAPRLSPLVNWGTFECNYPHYPDVESLQITDEERLITH